MNLLNTFLGTKKTFKHSVLGVLTSERIKGNNQTKKYSWFGAVNLNNYQKETFIVAEGNNNAPSKKHLEYISEIVTNWNTKYLKQIDQEIKKQKISQKPKFENWENDFYLGQITPLDDNKPHFELTLEPINENKTDFIGIEIDNNKVTKIEIYK